VYRTVEKGQNFSPDFEEKKLTALFADWAAKFYTKEYS
jgi:hypothetical protein